MSEFILAASGPLSSFWEWNYSLVFYFLSESFIRITILKGIRLNLSASLYFFFFCLLIPAGIPKKSENNFYNSGGIKEEGRVVVSGHLAAAGNEINAFEQQQLLQCVALFSAGLPSNP